MNIRSAIFVQMIPSMNKTSSEDEQAAGYPRLEKVWAAGG